MEKVKEFVKENRNVIMVGLGAVVIFRIGYRCGAKAYKRVVSNVFNTMRKYDYNTVRLVSQEVTK